MSRDWDLAFTDDNKKIQRYLDEGWEPFDSQSMGKGKNQVSFRRRVYPPGWECDVCDIDHIPLTKTCPGCLREEPAKGKKDSGERRA